MENIESKPVTSAGEATIKSQYILKRKQTQVENDQIDQTTTDERPPAAKRRKKERGQNKRRPRAAKVNLSDLLCPSLYQGRSSTSGRSCQFGDKCRYSHDCEQFLANKPPDIGESCYLFTTLGRCPYGLACRYGNSHVTADQRNVINDDLFDPDRVDTTRNIVSRSLQEKLRKKRLDLPKSDTFLRDFGEGRVGNRKTADKSGAQRKESEGREGGRGGEVGGGYQGVVSGEMKEGKKESNALERQEEAAHVQSGEKVDVSLPGLTMEDNSSIEDVPAKEDSHLHGSIEKGNESILSFTEKGDESATERGGDSILSFTEKCESGIQNPTNTAQRAVITIDAVAGDDLIKLRPAEKKKIDFRDKLFLAPLTTVGNLPFRRICKEFGADITCGEMAMSTNLLQGQQSEWALLKRHQSEDLFGVQVCGAHVDSMTQCAEMISKHVEVDFIDINVGCPIDLVCNKGAGCALMDRHTRFGAIVRGMTTVADCPITVKMRAGVHNRNWNAHKLVPKLRDWGVAMATIHGRSREQRYTKLADWEYIVSCAQSASPMPVFGCGDVLSYEDYALHSTEVGVMVARGALIKPWIFTEIKEKRHWDISSSERLDILRRYTNYGLEHWGSDTIGVENTRKFLLEWLSFLYRYIPVGLLERLPQRINERPPHYVGRDDLETLMASHYCEDWIKISEMLLGPVPANFSFLPKHKANSYS